MTGFVYGLVACRTVVIFFYLLCYGRSNGFVSTSAHIWCRRILSSVYNTSFLEAATVRLQFVLIMETNRFSVVLKS
jgi:hypothetical protein